MSSPYETKLFINGEYVASRTGERMSLKNPADGSLVTDDIHVAAEEDVDAAVAAARAAFPAWSLTAPQQRAVLLNKLADLVEANSEALVQAEVAAGKPKIIAFYGEVQQSARQLRYYAGWCDKIIGETLPATEGFLRIVTHEPLGVCAAVCPFNAPVLMAVAKAGPALAAGNTVIIKPSEKTPLGTLVLGRLASEAGFPPGVFNIVSGAGSTGALLASHLDIDKISFTGSSSTGRRIAEAAARSNLKRVSLELGGKSPAIVFDDANLGVAVEWCIRGITTLTGQICIANSRVYVHKAVKDEFLKQFKAGLAATESVTGDPALDTTMIGPLVDKVQYDRVMSYVEMGKKEASLFYGGSGGLASANSKGYFMQPVVFVGAGPNARIVREEIFGPVVVVDEFEDEQDVVARANDSEFGLSSAIFSQDVNRALRVASKMQSGTVCVNCAVQNQVEVPFGGMKQSGWGRENGLHGVLSYTETKTTFVNLSY